MKEQMSIWDNDNPLIKIHHPLIFAQFGYVELNSMRLFLLMLAKWDMEAPPGTPIRIPIADIIKSNDIGGKQFNLIVKNIDEMNNKMKNVKIEQTIKGKRSYIAMTVIDYLKYVEGSDYVEGAFGTKIQEYLRELKGRFTLAELTEVFQLKSSYAIRLFMIGKTFYPGFEELRFTVPELRTILGCESESYDQYKIFKNRILLPNIQALMHTSAAFDIEEDKQGTKSVKELIIRPMRMKVLKAAPVSESLHTQLKRLKITTTKIFILIDKGEIDEGYITYCIQHVQENLLQLNTIKKPAGLIHEYIVKKTLYPKYQETLPKVYTAPKPIKPQGHLKFESIPDMKKTYKNDYDRITQAMIEGGYSWMEKNGIAGLGIWE